jgi:hypothetical protein
MEYLAGLLDADGNIALTIYHRKDRTLGIAITPLVRISMKMNEKVVKLFEDLKKEYGGHISYDKKDLMITWQIKSAKTLRNSLPELLPHLRIKDEQARLLLEALDYLPKSVGKPIGLGNIKKLLDISLRITELNQRKGFAIARKEFVNKIVERYNDLVREINRKVEEGLRKEALGLQTPLNKQLEAIEMYRRGIEVKEIAKKIGVTPSTIWRIMKRNNIPLRRRRNRPRAQEHP